ncbi:disease resistance protein RGA2-like [Oryza glaberrima]|uniref:disease resistance protein RGA2-like n=1 Tax=Oryza glaberrima TaxID=4538 RepID=UPI00224C22A4|nr:disease resistance protein RGA2-like [Oryza glaberrima]
MAGVGEVLTPIVLREVARKLGSAARDQVTAQWNFTRDLDGMRTTLESVNALLRDRSSGRRRRMFEYIVHHRRPGGQAPSAASPPPVLAYHLACPAGCRDHPPPAHRTSAAREEPVRLWLKRLKRAAYDISDMLDEFQSTEPDAGKKKGVFHKLATAPSRFPMANPRPQLPELTDESVIIGRSEDKRNIIAALLTRGSEEVHVSQTFDLDKIVNTIISHVAYPEKESFISDIQLMRKRLAGLLEGRRILIVLDNIWESDQFKLDNLKIMLNVGKKGSEVDVIVTTRTEEIAKRICTVKPYKLEPLNDDICWAIIKIYSAFEGRGDKQQVEVIGQEIATKCGGGNITKYNLIHQWIALGFIEPSITFSAA